MAHKRMVIVPIEEMTNEEVSREADQRQAAGEGEHAAELREYLRIRTIIRLELAREKRKRDEAPSQELEIGQRVIVHARRPWASEDRDVSGVLVGLDPVRRGRPRRYRVESPACSPGQIDQWNVTREMLSVAEDSKSGASR